MPSLLKSLTLGASLATAIPTTPPPLTGFSQLARVSTRPLSPLYLRSCFLPLSSTLPPLSLYFPPYPFSNFFLFQFEN